MDNRQIDKLIAEKVMGFEFNDRFYSDSSGQAYEIDGLPKYSTDITAVWRVVEKLGDQHLVTIRTGSKPMPGSTYSTRYGSVTINGEYTQADTVPMAICLAALKLIKKTGP